MIRLLLSTTALAALISTAPLSAVAGPLEELETAMTGTPPAGGGTGLNNAGTASSGRSFQGVQGIITSEDAGATPAEGGVAGFGTATACQQFTGNCRRR